MNQPGLHLSYRRGYFSNNPAEATHGDKQIQASAMQAAMMHGAPQPSELLFDVRVIPADGTSDKLSPGSQPDPKLMQPPYRTYQLDTLLDIHNMQMTHANDGKIEGTLDFSVMVYDSDGGVVNAKARTVHSNLSPAQYADLLAHGVTASPAIEVPAKGIYFIRIGIRDEASNRIGAVEIPVASLQSKQAMILASTRPPAKQ